LATSTPGILFTFIVFVAILIDRESMASLILRKTQAVNFGFEDRTGTGTGMPSSRTG